MWGPTVVLWFNYLQFFIIQVSTEPWAGLFWRCMSFKWCCATISCRDWQQPSNHQHPAHRPLWDPRARVRLFINLVRDSISVITVMKPIVSFTRSLRHVLNSIQTRLCAVVSELRSLSHSTSLYPPPELRHNTTNCRLQRQLNTTHSFHNKRVTNIKTSPLTWTMLTNQPTVLEFI